MINLQINELLGRPFPLLAGANNAHCPLDHPVLGKLRVPTHKLRHARQALRCPKNASRVICSLRCLDTRQSHK